MIFLTFLKVQSFFRGWLCRRRWKQIVEEYIKSPHAESMRKRNQLVFSMVEAEEEYMEQLEVYLNLYLIVYTYRNVTRIKLGMTLGIKILLAVKGSDMLK